MQIYREGAVKEAVEKHDPDSSYTPKAIQRSCVDTKSIDRWMRIRRHSWRSDAKSTLDTNRKKLKKVFLGHDCDFFLFPTRFETEFSTV